MYRALFTTTKVSELLNLIDSREPIADSLITICDIETQALFATARSF